MDRTSILLVQNSFARVYAHKAELTDRFYANLFEALPEAERLFKQDFFYQKEMFTTMLASTVRSLASVDTFRELGERLARQHAGVGVAPEQYGTAAKALINAMRDVLDGEISEEEERAWRLAIESLTGRMTEGAEQG